MNPLREQMLQISTGYWLSKAVQSAARAGVADHLRDGPASVVDLAARAKVQPENLQRLLRALASVGIFEETDPGVFRLTPSAELLRADHPETVKHFALMACGDLFEAWCDFDHTLATGESAVHKRFGRDFFARIARDPEKSQIFDRAMQEIHGGETEFMVGGFDFARFKTVMDVGGGNGSTLRGILAAQGHLQGLLFDLPHVVDNARAHAGPPDVESRIQFHPGDFFREITGRADAIVMRHVLHDWSDEDCAKILSNAVSALEDGGSLLIVEKVITPGNDPGFVKLLDLNMMAIGGKERTEPQYRDLLATAGLRLHAVHTIEGPIDVVEARR
jgi:hypothetical protein